VSTFDPYREWLGLELAGRKPTFYELLNLPAGENDLAVLRAALDERTNRVRHARPGANVEAWQKLLDELGEARRCLTDPAKKQAYDQQFSAGVTGPPSGRAPSMEIEVTPTTSLNPLPPSAADLVMASMPPASVPTTSAPAGAPTPAETTQLPGTPAAPQTMPAWVATPGATPYAPGYAAQGAAMPQMPPGMMPAGMMPPGGAFGAPQGFPPPGAMPPGYGPTPPAYGPTGAPVAMAIPVAPSPYYGGMPPMAPGATWPAPSTSQWPAPSTSQWPAQSTSQWPAPSTTQWPAPPMSPMPGYGMAGAPMGAAYGVGAMPSMNDPMAPVSLPETADSPFAPSFHAGPSVALAPVTAVAAPDEVSPEVAAPQAPPQLVVARRRESSQTRAMIGAIAALAGIVPLVFLLVYLLGDPGKSSLADRDRGAGASDSQNTKSATAGHSIPRPNETPSVPPSNPPEQKPDDPPPVEPKPAPEPKMDKPVDEPKPVEPKPEPTPPMPKPVEPQPPAPEAQPVKPARPSAVADMVRALTTAKELLAKRNVNQAKVG
jgi:hypothetical protein